MRASLRAASGAINHTSNICEQAKHLGVIIMF
jgi:hypothetical protein